MLELAQLNEEL